MLHIRLLGQFDIRVNGKRVLIPTRAAQSLLAYLVLTAGIPHRREKLAGMFWPDTTDETARKNLRQELWRIRKAIAAQQRGDGEYLLADEFTLAFNREAEYWLDVFQMERPDLESRPHSDVNQDAGNEGDPSSRPIQQQECKPDLPEEHEIGARRRQPIETGGKHRRKSMEDVEIQNIVDG